MRAYEYVHSHLSCGLVFYFDIFLLAAEKYIVSLIWLKCQPLFVMPSRTSWFDWYVHANGTSYPFYVLLLIASRYFSGTC